MEIWKINSGAEFSECRKYRYALWRIWDESKPLVMFIGLNPSTANETEPDNTITRVIGMARGWGYGGVYMMNCFPYVTSNPDELIIDYFNLNLNNDWLEKIAGKCKDIVFAWGKFEIVKKMQRDKDLCRMFPNALVLIKNKDGSPRHPLYVPGKTTPFLFADSLINQLNK